MITENALSTTLRNSFAPWFLGDLDGFIDTANKMRKAHSANNYPPHNVFRVNEDTIVLQMALAGINPDRLKLVSNGTSFKISYEPEPEVKSEEQYTQYQSISTRKFSKTFKLEEPWEIVSATLNCGLLEVTVSRKTELEKEIEIKIKSFETSTISHKTV